MVFYIKFLHSHLMSNQTNTFTPHKNLKSIRPTVLKKYHYIFDCQRVKTEDTKMDMPFHLVGTLFLTLKCSTQSRSL